ncbi:MAG: hypothetical protein A2252_06720 [Elusimicrobia bacterium RIFOXYA2_FULL_39_19]|nr:MAG: hypothetical protein A2252_06720 [Elusimicrobia bacterium RIFOXYA2_FULL_39_19]
MEKEIGFGIIGCGTIASWHINGIENTKGAKLVAVCDRSEDKAKKTASEKNVDYYTGLGEMLKRKDLDVVCICTPSSLHTEQAIAAAQAGKHVITEKPMAITLEKANRMIDVCKKNKVKLSCVFQLRFTEPYAKIKKVIDSGELGKLTLGDCYLKYYRSQAYYDSAGWRGTWEFDGGGALMNQGIHMIDLLQWYMGPVESVFGHCKTLARKIEVEDTAAAVIKFKNGAIGVIEGTTSVFPSNIPHRLELHGDRGSIMFSGSGLARWEVEGPDGKVIDKLQDTAKETQKAITKPTDISWEGHQQVIGDMVSAIKENREPVVTGEDGKKALEIILAIYESSKTGKEIKLP